MLLQKPLSKCFALQLSPKAGFQDLLSTLGSLEEATNCWKSWNVRSVLKADNYQKMTSEQPQPHNVVLVHPKAVHLDLISYH